MDGWMEACMWYILNAIATCISSCPTEWLKTSKEWFLSREGLSEPAGCTQSCPGTVPARNGCSCERALGWIGFNFTAHIPVHLPSFPGGFQLNRQCLQVRPALSSDMGEGGEEKSFNFLQVLLGASTSLLYISPVALSVFWICALQCSQNFWLLMFTGVS